MTNERKTRTRTSTVRNMRLKNKLLMYRDKAMLHNNELHRNYCGDLATLRDENERLREEVAITRSYLKRMKNSIVIMDEQIKDIRDE